MPSVARGARRIVPSLLLLALLIMLASVPAQARKAFPESPADVLEFGYGLLVDVVVSDDATSMGTASIVASATTLRAIATYYGISQVAACRLIAYGSQDTSVPFFLNPRLWEESGSDSTESCAYSFSYGPGTRLDVFSLDEKGRVTYYELFSEPGRGTLLRIGDRVGTVWDERLVRSLSEEYGLLDLNPILVVRITYPHVPDGSESHDADLVDGHTLVWRYRATDSGDGGDEGMEGGASPLSNGTTASPLHDESESAAGYPWWVLVGLGAVSAGWMLGRSMSTRPERRRP